MNKFPYTVMLLVAGVLLWSCNSSEEEIVRHDLVPAVAAAPEDGYSINLDDFADTLHLGWSSAEWDGPGYPVYSVAFDSAEGDFSNPLSIYYVPEIGASEILLTKAELKEIYNAAAAGEKISALDVKWIVRTSAYKSFKCGEPRVLALSMTPDPDAFKAGNDIYIDGEGALEAGRKMVYIPNTTYSWNKSISAHYLDNAPRCKEFDYEIFTKLEAEAPFFLWSGDSTGDKDWILEFDSRLSSDALSYSLSTLREASCDFYVPATGVYRIRLNSATREVYVKMVSTVRLRYWAPVSDNEMTYDGNGVWHVDLNVPSGKVGYKFLFAGLDGDQPTGAQYPSETVPAVDDLSVLNPADKYWNIVPVQGGAANGNKANGTFLFLSPAFGNTLRYTLYMNDTYGTYTHCVSSVE